MKRLIFLWMLSQSIYAEQFELTLQEAEQQTLKTSDRLKAAGFDAEAAKEQASAGLATLFPRVYFQGSYTYLSTLSSLSLNNQSFTFGAHNNYNVGPALSYTLWDTLSSLRAFQALSKLKESKEQDRINAELQLLFVLRVAYVRVQLALEELRLVNGSLNLVRAQQRDVQNRFNAGAATKLDKLSSEKQVLNYQLQFQQKQADLSSSLKDLLALVGNKDIKDVSQPGPAGVDSVTLILKLDSLADTLDSLNKLPILEPTDEQPQIKSLRLLAESSSRSASAQTAKLFPTLQLSASSVLMYPNGPIASQINQNSVGLVLSIPLYLGDPTWHQAASKRREALAAKHRAMQLKTDMVRDFSKAAQMVDSLYGQKKMANQNVIQSEEAASLYYGSYKAGKSNFTDVQMANNQALEAKVVSARIDAQILTQLISQIALSAKEEVSYESP